MSAPCPILGFVVRVRLRDTGADPDSFIDGLTQVLRSNGLVTGEGGDRRLEYVVSREGSQATQADRELILEWAKGWQSIAQVEVSELVDLQED